MSNIYIRCTDPEKWRDLLADAETQWRSAYSAIELAYSWSMAEGFPAEVDAALQKSPLLHGIELLLAIPEHQVPLPGGTHPSQSDIWVLARVGRDMVSIAVEGKVKEPFDKLVREWRADSSAGKNIRLAYLAETLELPSSQLDAIRYQLLHRTASAVIEARRFGAGHAVMLVHSFSKMHEHFEDFQRFVTLYGTACRPETVVSVNLRSGLRLSFAWVTGVRKTFRERKEPLSHSSRLHV